MSRKKSKYAFVPLLESKLNFNAMPTPEQQEHLRKFYLILKDQDRFVGWENGRYIMFNAHRKEIGFANFNLETDLTLESSPSEIHTEVERFFKARYKQISMNVYPSLKAVHL